MPKIVNLTKVDLLIDHLSVDVCNSILNKLPLIPQTEDLWDAVSNDPDFIIVKDHFKLLADQLLAHGSNLYSSAKIDRAWLVDYKDNQYLTPHYHGGSFITGIFYLEADENSGDLLVQDPLASFNWVNRYDNGRSGRASMPIKPSKGMMIVMPGYLVHSTQPKPPGTRRTIISTNFNVFENRKES